MMTLIQLQEHLGEMVESLMSHEGNTVRFQHDREKAEYLCKLAKQMNNTADNVIRTSKMANEINEARDFVFGKR